MNAPSSFTGPRYHNDLIQGSDEWLQARCGLLTASEMKLIVTPSTLKAASNDKERAHLFELAAQRVTRYVEPCYIGDDMLRGMDDEVEATRLYSERYAKIERVGFITNDKWGFTIGYSPDGKLAGQSAGIENKSRRQKFQIETICDLAMPPEYVIQVQTGLLVSDWEWIDFNSYCGGMPMVTLRVFPDDAVQKAIVAAAGAFEDRLKKRLEQFAENLASDARLLPTERRIEQEMFA